MNTYLIPREGRTQQEYFDYVGTLPWVFVGDPAFQIDPNGQKVTVDGTITGFERVATPSPSQVTPQQFRRALTRVGLRAAVEAAVATASQDMKDEWNFSTAILRNQPDLNAMATALGVSQSQLDDVFILAATL
jgi:hypothetical protein